MTRHERLVPDIMIWELTECDVNKDIKVSDSLNLCGIKMQVKYFDRLFPIYIELMGKDTVCRVEERKNLHLQLNPSTGFLIHLKSMLHGLESLTFFFAIVPNIPKRKKES